ncbi:MAG: tRNA-dihydrouridine synthase [Microbacteriaceae bacterium BACL28 MAG-120531-bin53]|nr:MAG: tRNA-dihydrouridine synthase [Microbacteriaceae bacterium BACL28 MAG-120531-bin53]
MGLTYGTKTFEVPVVLAPMAGITNTAFRRLCREYGNGLFVSEMVTSRALVERTEESMRLIGHHESEEFRSVQLYGVDPATISRAIEMLVQEDRADHIDLNFGCPVAKVTRKGGGAALPWKSELFEAIVQAAVRAAGTIPVTVKMRKGIDQDHLTFLDAGKAARDAGVTAVALHGRTAEDFYSGRADWDAIAELRESLPDVQVLGNGDIWSAQDAVSMMDKTGVDGIVVGRGCLGRPWLFQDLERAIAGYLAGDKNPQVDEVMPSLGEVADAFYRHAELLTEFFDEEGRACRDIRKHVAWYFKGYPVGGEFRADLARVESLQQASDLLGSLERDTPYPGEEAEGPRGRLGSLKKCSLPEGWLDSRDLNDTHRAQLEFAELSVSGG